MTALDNVCDVCHREAPKVFVHASSVGPMSFASCMECLQNYAEMEGSFHYLYDDVGTRGENLADWVVYLTTWKDGKYMKWDEWVAWRRDPVRVDELDKQAEEAHAEYEEAIRKTVLDDPEIP
jgi:hypothetical protein